MQLPKILLRRAGREARGPTLHDQARAALLVAIPLLLMVVVPLRREALLLLLKERLLLGIGCAAVYRTNCGVGATGRVRLRLLHKILVLVISNMATATSMAFEARLRVIVARTG